MNSSKTLDVSDEVIQKEFKHDFLLFYGLLTGIGKPTCFLKKRKLNARV
jgi:hypothetical protein